MWYVMGEGNGFRYRVSASVNIFAVGDSVAVHSIQSPILTAPRDHLRPYFATIVVISLQHGMVNRFILLVGYPRAKIEREKAHNTTTLDHHGGFFCFIMSTPINNGNRECYSLVVNVHTKIPVLLGIAISFTK